MGARELSVEKRQQFPSSPPPLFLLPFLSALLFIFHAPLASATPLLSITSVFPDATIVTGSTTIYVQGTGFSVPPSVFVRVNINTFGVQALSNVVATVVNDTQLSFAFPSLTYLSINQPSFPITLTALASSNPSVQVGNLRMTVYDPAMVVLSAITPANASATAASTSVTLSGSNLPNVTNALCVYSRVPSQVALYQDLAGADPTTSAELTTPAVILSPQAAQCTLQASNPNIHVLADGVITVRLALGGWSGQTLPPASNLAFTFFMPSPQLEEVSFSVDTADNLLLRWDQPIADTVAMSVAPSSQLLAMGGAGAPSNVPVPFALPPATTVTSPPCANIFDSPTLARLAGSGAGVTLMCQWLSARELLVSNLGPQTTVLPGQTLTLFGAWQQRRGATFGYLPGQSSTSASSAALVTSPSIKTFTSLPIISLQAPSMATMCDNSGNGSGGSSSLLYTWGNTGYTITVVLGLHGNLGYAPPTIAWTVKDVSLLSSGVAPVSVSSAAWDVDASSNTVLTIYMASLDINTTTVLVTADVTSVFGLTQSANTNIAISTSGSSSGPSVRPVANKPIMWIAGGSPRSVSAFVANTIEVNIQPSCLPLAAIPTGNYTLSWSLTTLNTTSPNASAPVTVLSNSLSASSIQSRHFLTIPARTLLPGNQYTFTVSATSADNNQWSTSASLFISPQPLFNNGAAALLGGNRTITLGSNATLQLVDLNLPSSVDLGASSNADLMFFTAPNNGSIIPRYLISWSCYILGLPSASRTPCPSSQWPTSLSSPSTATTCPIQAPTSTPPFANQTTTYLITAVVSLGQNSQMVVATASSFLYLLPNTLSALGIAPSSIPNVFTSSVTIDPRGLLSVRGVVPYASPGSILRWSSTGSEAGVATQVNLSTVKLYSPLSRTSGNITEVFPLIMPTASLTPGAGYSFALSTPIAPSSSLMAFSQSFVRVPFPTTPGRVSVVVSTTGDSASSSNQGLISSLNISSPLRPTATLIASGFQSPADALPLTFEFSIMSEEAEARGGSNGNSNFWVLSTGSSAVLSSVLLPPGNNTIRVRVRNAKGMVSSATTTVTYSLPSTMSFPSIPLPASTLNATMITLGSLSSQDISNSIRGALASDTVGALAYLQSILLTGSALQRRLDNGLLGAAMHWQAKVNETEVLSVVQQAVQLFSCASVDQLLPVLQNAIENMLYRGTSPSPSSWFVLSSQGKVTLAGFLSQIALVLGTCAPATTPTIDSTNFKSILTSLSSLTTPAILQNRTAVDDDRISAALASAVTALGQGMCRLVQYGQNMLSIGTSLAAAHAIVGLPNAASSPLWGSGYVSFDCSVTNSTDPSLCTFPAGSMRMSGPATALALNTNLYTALKPNSTCAASMVTAPYSFDACENLCLFATQFVADVRSPQQRSLRLQLNDTMAITAAIASPQSEVALVASKSNTLVISPASYGIGSNNNNNNNNAADTYSLVFNRLSLPFSTSFNNYAYTPLICAAWETTTNVWNSSLCTTVAVPASNISSLSSSFSSGYICQCSRRAPTALFAVCPPGFLGLGCASLCPFGSFGQNCSLRNPCSNNGIADNVDGRCTCHTAGYTGSDCGSLCNTTVALSLSQGLKKYGVRCSNNCTCAYNTTCNPIDGSCTCRPGLNGTDCGNIIDQCAINNQPCQNGATCSFGINTYSCACVNGYAGVNCQTDINECAGVDCNGGTCIDLVARFYCQCLPGRTGSQCTRFCTTPSYGPNCSQTCRCQNGADCNPVTGACTCVGSWEGTYCDMLPSSRNLAAVIGPAVGVPLALIVILAGAAIYYYCVVLPRRYPRRSAKVRDATSSSAPVSVEAFMESGGEMMSGGSTLSERAGRVSDPFFSSRASMVDFGQSMTVALLDAMNLSTLSEANDEAEETMYTIVNVSKGTTLFVGREAFSPLDMLATVRERLREKYPQQSNQGVFYFIQKDEDLAAPFGGLSLGSREQRCALPLESKTILLSWFPNDEIRFEIVGYEREACLDFCTCGRVSMFECSKCQAQSYCSSECQLTHWTEHSPICRAMVRAGARATASSPTQLLETAAKMAAIGGQGNGAGEGQIGAGANLGEVAGPSAATVFSAVSTTVAQPAAPVDSGSNSNEPSERVVKARPLGSETSFLGKNDGALISPSAALEVVAVTGDSATVAGTAAGNASQGETSAGGERSDEQKLQELCICGQPVAFECSGCQLKSYCSSRCQRRDWASHRPICRSKSRKASRASMSSQEGMLMSSTDSFSRPSGRESVSLVPPVPPKTISEVEEQQGAASGAGGDVDPRTNSGDAVAASSMTPAPVNSTADSATTTAECAESPTIHDSKEVDSAVEAAALSAYATTTEETSASALGAPAGEETPSNAAASRPTGDAVAAREKIAAVESTSEGTLSFDAREASANAPADREEATLEPSAPAVVSEESLEASNESQAPLPAVKPADSAEAIAEALRELELVQHAALSDALGSTTGSSDGGKHQPSLVGAAWGVAAAMMMLNHPDAQEAKYEPKEESSGGKSGDLPVSGENEAVDTDKSPAAPPSPVHSPEHESAVEEHDTAAASNSEPDNAAANHEPGDNAQSHSARSGADAPVAAADAESLAVKGEYVEVDNQPENDVPAPPTQEEEWSTTEGADTTIAAAEGAAVVSESEAGLTDDTRPSRASTARSQKQKNPEAVSMAEEVQTLYSASFRMDAGSEGPEEQEVDTEKMSVPIPEIRAPEGEEGEEHEVQKFTGEQPVDHASEDEDDDKDPGSSREDNDRATPGSDQRLGSARGRSSPRPSISPSERSDTLNLARVRRMSGIHVMVTEDNHDSDDEQGDSSNRSSFDSSQVMFPSQPLRYAHKAQVLAPAAVPEQDNESLDASETSPRTGDGGESHPTE